MEDILILVIELMEENQTNKYNPHDFSQNIVVVTCTDKYITSKDTLISGHKGFLVGFQVSHKRFIGEMQVISKGERKVCTDQSTRSR